MGLWQCPICTYNNDDSLLSCDTCGVFRDYASAPKSNDENKVRDTGMGTGASILAKSLFARTPRPVSEANVISCNLLSNEANGSYEKGNTKARFGFLQKIFTAPEHNNSIIIGLTPLLQMMWFLLQGILQELVQRGKGSFAYAWAMDESTEERERGITMTVAVAYFETEKYRVVLLDSPGHKDFVPNMISGVAQADAAILVVDASIGSFESGMVGMGIGQTREHAQLIRSFGVEQIIIAVNKMDAVEYLEERFDFIKMQLGSFLRSYGFKESNVTWVPLSVMENQNLVTAASDVRLSCWYKGSCLLDAIDSLRPPPREISKPLLLPICDAISSHSLGQVAACGKLERGALRSGSKVIVMPSRDLATVRAIERDSSPCTVARAGDNVAVGLQGVDGGCVIPGGVLCHPEFPATVASRLELKILVLEITTPILIGSQVEFHIHHVKTVAKVVKILSLIDQKSGKTSKKPPRLLTAKQSAIIEVSLDEAVCVEEFSNCRALGRVFLRAAGNTIAVGIVARVIEPETANSSAH